MLGAAVPLGNGSCTAGFRGERRAPRGDRRIRFIAFFARYGLLYYLTLRPHHPIREPVIFRKNAERRRKEHKPVSVEITPHLSSPPPIMN